MKQVLFYLLFCIISPSILIYQINAQEQEKEQRRCNGYNEYCKKRVTELAYPSTHNSYATPITRDQETSFFVNQDLYWTIDKQLESGIRHLELDLHYTTTGIWNLCHYQCTTTTTTTTHNNTNEPSSPPLLQVGFSGPTLKQVFNIIIDFLEHDPNNIIFITFEFNNNNNNNNNSPSFEQLDNDFKDSGFDELLYYHQDENDEWPTLETLIQQNKKVIAFGPESLTTTTTTIQNIINPLNPNYSQEQFDAESIKDLNCLTNNNNNNNDDNSFTPFFRVNHWTVIKLTDDIYFPDRNQVPITNSKTSLDYHISKCNNINNDHDDDDDDDMSSISSSIGGSSSNSERRRSRRRRRRNVTFIAVDFGKFSDLIQVVAEYNNVDPTYAMQINRRVNGIIKGDNGDDIITRNGAGKTSTTIKPFTFLLVVVAVVIFSF